MTCSICQMISENKREKTMGGYGSGRPAYKQKAEHCRSLDVNRLHREGCLATGWAGNWVWRRDGAETGRISLRSGGDRVTLDYRVQSGGQDWQTVTETVMLSHVPCRYGGARPYFRCPGVVNGRYCYRRVGKLFAGGRYFLCRHCYGIAYASQSEDRHDRLLRRANKRRMALGGEPGTAHWIAPKPKGMWHRTYDQICHDIERCESEADLAFIQRFRHLLPAAELKAIFGG